MKRLYTLTGILFLSFLLLFNFNSSAQEFEFHPFANLYGGDIRTLDHNGTVKVYAGTPNGIYSSSNDGEEWEMELNGVTVNKIVVYSNEIKLAGTNNGLYVTMGKGWEKINNFTDGVITDLDVLTTGIIFVSVKNDGLYKGKIGEYNFTKVTNLGYYSYAYQITCSGPSTVFVDLNMSVDTGQTWIPIENGWPQYRFITAFDVNLEQGLIVAGTDNGVYRYDLDQETWIDLGLSQSCLDLIIDDNSRIFVGSMGGVYRSFDQGATWQQVNTGLSSAVVRSLTEKSNKIFAGTIYGINVCDVNGNEWTSANTGINEVSVYSILPLEDKFLMSSSRGVLLTDDGGVSWTKTRRVDVPVYFTETVHKFLQASNGTLYAGTGSGLYFSQNGIYWNIYTTYVGSQIYDFLFDNYGNIIKATSDGIFKSTDNGFTWTKLNENDYLGTVTCLAIDDDNNIYAGTNQGIYASTDDGENWENIADDTLQEAYFVRLIQSGNNLYAATNKGIFIYDTFYHYWISSHIGMGAQFVTDLIRRDNGDFYASSYNGIYYSNDSCAFWQPVDIGQASKMVTCLGFDPLGNFYFGTANNGAYTTRTSFTGINTFSDAQKKETCYNYPNPFSENTEIIYHIEGNGNQQVNVEIYDVTGRKLRTLLNRKETPGEHRLQFDASSFSPGIYYAVLHIGGQQRTVKMVINR